MIDMIQLLARVLISIVFIVFGFLQFTNIAGYTVKAFHGTPDGGFTEYKEGPNGIFFSSKRSVAG